jgi:hypothetical protein
MKEVQKDVERIEKGEAWEASEEVVQLKVKRPLEKVVPIRLQAEHWEELRKIAGELGVGPTTLARMWIIERLHRSQKELQPSVKNSINQ